MQNLLSMICLKISQKKKLKSFFNSKCSKKFQIKIKECFVIKKTLNLIKNLKKNFKIKLKDLVQNCAEQLKIF